MSFYRRVEKLRRPGESNREFAARLGILHPALALWKRQEAQGVLQKPTPSMVTRICKATGVDAQWLIWGDE
jgi:transcriptional regulator with XRE-family HTH domain